MRKLGVLVALAALALLAVSAGAQAEEMEDPLGYACVNPSGDANCGLVAASVAGNASAEYAAVTLTGNASSCGEDVGDGRLPVPTTCSAVSVTEPARGDWLALSGTESAHSDGAGVGAGNASGAAAASIFGQANGFYYASSGTDDAEAHHLAVSGTGNSTACRDQIVLGLSSCVAVSGTGDSSGWIAVSGTGNSSGWIAVSGTGSADSPFFGNAQWPFDGPLAASGTGDANGGCLAVSGTGTAKGKCWLFGSRLEASGCEAGRIFGSDTACAKFGLADTVAAIAAPTERETEQAFRETEHSAENESMPDGDLPDIDEPDPGPLPGPGPLPDPDPGPLPDPDPGPLPNPDPDPDPSPITDQDIVEATVFDDADCDADGCPRVAASVFGDARTPSLAAVSGTGNAGCSNGCPFVAASGTQNAKAQRLAVSALGDAECTIDPCVAVAGDTARGTVAVGVNGQAYGDLAAASVGGCAYGTVEVDTCDTPTPPDPDPGPLPIPNPDPDDAVCIRISQVADCDFVAVSVYNHARAGLVAVSVLDSGGFRTDRHAYCKVVLGCVAVSGLGDAYGGSVAVAGLGHAEAFNLAVGGYSAECWSIACAAVSVGPAYGGVLAVSGLGPAKAPVAAVSGGYANGGLLAVSAIGDAYSENGGAISGNRQAKGRLLAVTGTAWTAQCHDSASPACVAASGLGDADCNGVDNCVAVSGTDAAYGGAVAVSGGWKASADHLAVSDDRAVCQSDPCVAVAGGNARCNTAGPCVALDPDSNPVSDEVDVQIDRNAEGRTAAVSVFADASCENPRPVCVAIGDDYSEANTFAYGDDARCTRLPCVAYGTETAEGGAVAVNHEDGYDGGYAQAEYAAIGVQGDSRCSRTGCVAISGHTVSPNEFGGGGSASGGALAFSAEDDAHCRDTGCVAISVKGSASCSSDTCVAVGGGDIAGQTALSDTPSLPTGEETRQNRDVESRDSADSECGEDECDPIATLMRTELPE